MCPSFHTHGLSSTWHLCSQALYAQFSPQALFCQVCVYVSLSSLLLPFCQLPPPPLQRAGTRSHHPVPSWSFPQRSPIQWLWQLSFSRFLAGGAGCLGRVSSSGLPDRACGSGVEKQKPPAPQTHTHTLHPSLRRARQARDGDKGFGRAAKGRLAGGRPAHTHLTHAHTETQTLYCGLQLWAGAVSWS